LDSSLIIRVTGSHVPHESLNHVHATFMPAAAQAVQKNNRYSRLHFKIENCSWETITVDSIQEINRWPIQFCPGRDRLQYTFVSFLSFLCKDDPLH